VGFNTPQLAGGFFISVRRIAFGNNRFVATGDKGLAWYSDDGITWREASNTAALSDTTNHGNNLGSLGFGGGYFVSAGSSSGHHVRAWTTDGDIWHPTPGSSIEGESINGKGVAWGNGHFVVGGAGGSVFTGTNPTGQWTRVGPGVGGTTFDTEGTHANAYINSLAYGNGIFVAAGSSYGHSAYSTDNGASWRAMPQTEAIFSGWLNSVGFGAGRFVIAKESGGNLAYSEPNNGELWTQVVRSTLLGGVNIITYANGYFLIGDTLGKLAYSEDGIHWTASGSLRTAYGKGKWVVITSDGNAAYSIVE
jgi:hypothetical protein